MNSLCSVHSHGFRNAKAVVAVASVMSPFTTYNGSFTNTSVMTLAIGTYATLGGDTASVAVNMLQTKMLFCSKLVFTNPTFNYWFYRLCIITRWYKGGCCKLLVCYSIVFY